MYLGTAMGSPIGEGGRVGEGGDSDWERVGIGENVTEENIAFFYGGDELGSEAQLVGCGGGCSP